MNFENDEFYYIWFIDEMATYNEKEKELQTFKSKEWVDLIHSFIWYLCLWFIVFMIYYKKVMIKIWV